MLKRFPSLNALRAFDAAARHLNFTRAAEELCVSQGAVSRQVKLLESDLGIRLFRRGPRGLSLTDPGRKIAETVGQSFNAISRCLSAVADDHGILRLQASPTFAMRWLMPRVSGFQARHPHIELRLTITFHPSEFDDRHFDAALIYGAGDWAGLEATCISPEVLIPVCAPLVQQGPRPIHDLADLAHHTRLHNTVDRRDWPLWLNAVGASTMKMGDGPAFETLDLALRAAEAGHGVAIGDLTLLGEDLANGKLITPIKRPVASGRGIYLVHRPEMAGQEKVQRLRNWLSEIGPPIPRAEAKAGPETE